MSVLYPQSPKALAAFIRAHHDTVHRGAIALPDGRTCIFCNDFVRGDAFGAIEYYRLFAEATFAGECETAAVRDTWIVIVDGGIRDAADWDRYVWDSFLNLCNETQPAPPMPTNNATEREEV